MSTDVPIVCWGVVRRQDDRSPRVTGVGDINIDRPGQISLRIARSGSAVQLSAEIGAQQVILNRGEKTACTTRRTHWITGKIGSGRPPYIKVG